MARTTGTGEAITTSTTASSSPNRYRWAIFIVCYLAWINAFAGRLGLGPLGPFMRTGLSITRAQFGFFLTALMIGWVISSAGAGWLIDRLGVRKVLTFGQVFIGVCFMSLLFMKTYAGCLAVVFLGGMGMGFVLPGVVKAILLWFPLKERATVMGIVATATNFGGMVTAATLPALAIAYGWRAGFLAIGTVGVAFGIIFLLFYRSHSSELSKEAPSAAVKEETLRGEAAARKGEMLEPPEVPGDLVDRLRRVLPQHY